jgi:hypothetical protein
MPTVLVVKSAATLLAPSIRCFRAVGGSVRDPGSISISAGVAALRGLLGMKVGMALSPPGSSRRRHARVQSTLTSIL